MIRLLDNDDRVSVRWCNYKNRVGRVDAYTPMGPNTAGEYLWPVEVSFSRIGFSYLPPKEHNDSK